MSAKENKASNFEFTPIGYMKEKQSKGPSETNISPSQLNKDNDRTFDSEMEGPVRKQQRISADDTINSTRMFNDASQFDDTLPEIPSNNTTAANSNSNKPVNNLRKNLLSDLNENTIASNPIREQQAQKDILFRENSVLKLRCNALINFLKNVDQNGNVKENLGFLDELTKLREKYQVLIKDHKILQIDFDNLSQQKSNQDDQAWEAQKKDLETRINEREAELESLKGKIEEINSEKGTLSAKIKSLEALLDSRNENNDINDTISEQIDEISRLKEQLQALSSELHESNNIIDNYKERVSKLDNELPKLEAEVQEKETYISELEADLDKTKKSHDNAKKQLDNTIKELNNTNETFEKYRKEQERQIASIRHGDNGEIIAKNNELITLKEEHEKKVKQLEIQIKSLEQKVNDTKSEHDNSKRMLHETNNKYETDISQLREELVKEKTNSVMVRKELDREKTDSMMVREELDEEKSKSVMLREELDKEKTNSATLREDIERFKLELKEKEEKIKKVENTVAQLQDQLDNNSDKAGKSDNMVIELQDQLKSKRGEIERLAKHQNEIQLQLRASEDNYNKSREIIEDLKKQLDSKSEELDSKTKRLAKSSASIKDLQDQLFTNTIKASEATMKAIEDKEEEINDLRDQLNRVNERLNSSTVDNQSLEEKIQKRFDAKMKHLSEQNELEKEVLQLKIDSLEKEKSALNEMHSKEIDSWSKRYDALGKENDKLLNEDKSDSYKMKKDMLEKDAIVQDLTRKLNQNEKDTLRMKSELVELIKAKDEQLRKAIAKAEEFSDDYIRLKKRNNSEEQYGIFKEKYSSMQKRLLDRITILENENVRLEDQIRREKLYSQDSDITSNLNVVSQDRADYYRLKYHKEIKQNNDLRVMNDYLNKVLRASTQKVRSDLLRCKEELSTSSPTPTFYEDYLSDRKLYDYMNARNVSAPFNPSQRESIYRFRSPRLKFKTVALMVKACIRMKQVALKHDWDNQRLKYLERKIKTNEDHITW